MSSLRARLLALRRSLGRRGTAALAVTVLGAVTVAAVAVAGGQTNTTHKGTAMHPVQRSATGPTGTTASPTLSHPPAAKHHRRHEARRASVAPRLKAAAPQPSAGSVRRAHHQARTRHTRHTSPSTSTPSPTPTTTTPSGPSSVTLVVHGGGNASVLACGDTHHFRTYRVGASLSFSGAVRPVPSGQWKVKLHIKVCQGGAYQDFAKIDAHENKSTGTFHGTFSAPPRGLYEVRAVLYLGASEATESDKVHLESR